MIILETKELTKQFGGLTAVNAVSMHINEGDIVGLIGPNGAGKTTLVNAMAGLNPPTSGQVFIFGEGHHRQDPGEDVPAGPVAHLPDPRPLSQDDRAGKRHDRGHFRQPAGNDQGPGGPQP
jgi:ABC-type branched-subunit amino acid transport system ATPase component